MIPVVGGKLTFSGGSTAVSEKSFQDETDVVLYVVVEETEAALETEDVEAALEEPALTKLGLVDVDLREGVVLGRDAAVVEVESTPVETNSLSVVLTETAVVFTDLAAVVEVAKTLVLLTDSATSHVFVATRSRIPARPAKLSMWNV